MNRLHGPMSTPGNLQTGCLHQPYQPPSPRQPQRFEVLVASIEQQPNAPIPFPEKARAHQRLARRPVTTTAQSHTNRCASSASSATSPRPPEVLPARPSAPTLRFPPLSKKQKKKALRGVPETLSVQAGNGRRITQDHHACSTKEDSDLIDRPKQNRTGQPRRLSG